MCANGTPDKAWVQGPPRALEALAYEIHSGAFELFPSISGLYLSTLLNVINVPECYQPSCTLPTFLNIINVPEHYQRS